MKYIDAEKLIKSVNNYQEGAKAALNPIDGDADYYKGKIDACKDMQEFITSLQQKQTDMGEVSDGYHTFNELYYYRMLYNAAFFNLLPKELVHKSRRHHTGEECFGGGWFIVMANLPTGQISNHYELKDWDLFKVPEKEFADKWDGHTPQEAADRLHKYLQQEQEKSKNCNDCPHCVDRKDQYGWHFKGCFGGIYKGKFIAEIDECPLKQEQPEVDLDFQVFSKEMDAVFNFPKEVTENTEEDPLNWEYAIARHFYELGLNARKKE